MWWIPARGKNYGYVGGSRAHPIWLHYIYKLLKLIWPSSPLKRIVNHWLSILFTAPNISSMLGNFLFHNNALLEREELGSCQVWAHTGQTYPSMSSVYGRCLGTLIWYDRRWIFRSVVLTYIIFYLNRFGFYVKSPSMAGWYLSTECGSLSTSFFIFYHLRVLCVFSPVSLML